jgi:hypothetical protein
LSVGAEGTCHGQFHLFDLQFLQLWWPNRVEPLSIFSGPKKGDKVKQAYTGKIIKAMGDVVYFDRIFYIF